MKRKAIPVTHQGCTMDARKILTCRGLTYCLHSRLTEVRLSALLYPTGGFRTHFCYRLSQSQGACEKIWSIEKKKPTALPGIQPATFLLVA